MPRKDKSAQAAYMRQYKEIHPEVIKKSHATYSEKHREKINQRGRERYSREREKYGRQAREYRDKNRAELRAQEQQRNLIGRVVPSGDTPRYELCFSSPSAYRQWLNDEIEADTIEQGFKKWRRKAKNFFPISYRRWPLYRRLLDEVLGPRCRICGFAGRLELAHLAYFGDSVRSKDRDSAASFRRVIEALEHPDRFARLCSLCHDVFDYARKNGGADYLKRIEALMSLAEEMQDASRTL